MPHYNDLEKRRANVLHVHATNRLSGARVSSYMAAKMEEYASSHLSSAQLIAETKLKYSAHGASLPSKS